MFACKSAVIQCEAILKKVLLQIDIGQRNNSKVNILSKSDKFNLKKKRGRNQVREITIYCQCSCGF